uniref:Clone ZZD1378 mRNA sequence n=1 Tax=Schistosoma japonicum TaxID=6182 RepID=Q86EV5_SCHJA|nr:hypothetical protein [Schistosoma japonicum]
MIFYVREITGLLAKNGHNTFLKYDIVKRASSHSFEISKMNVNLDDLQPKPLDRPIITSRELHPPVYCSPTRNSRLAWLETLKPLGLSQSSNTQSLVGMVDLHPDIFAVFPRIDLVHKNLYWQAHYRLIDWRCNNY